MLSKKCACGQSYIVKKSMSKGFTLFELIVTISIVAILLLVTIPAMNHIVEKNRSDALINQVMTALRFARAQAVVKHEQLTYCGSSDLKACDGDWHAGQIVIDEKRGVVLRVFGSLAHGYDLSWHGSFGRNNALQFKADGFTNGQQGSFLISKGAKRLASLVIMQTGRTRVSEG